MDNDKIVYERKVDVQFSNAAKIRVHFDKSLELFYLTLLGSCGTPIRLNGLHARWFTAVQRADKVTLW